MAKSDDPPRRGESWFAENLPALIESECHFTSKCTWDYNCVGFVVGDFRWWHPEDLAEHYWPDGVDRDIRKWAHQYVTALETVHFERVDAEPEFDPKFEKIVILHKGGVFKHVSLQVAPDRWKSKLGEFEDLEHEAEAVRNGEYGSVFVYMRRPIRFGGAPIPAEYLL